MEARERADRELSEKRRYGAGTNRSNFEQARRYPEEERPISVAGQIDRVEPRLIRIEGTITAVQTRTHR